MLLLTRPTANVIEGNYFYQSRISHNSGQLMEVSFTRCWVCPLITCNSQEAIITILEKGLYQPSSSTVTRQWDRPLARVIRKPMHRVSEPRISRFPGDWRHWIVGWGADSRAAGPREARGGTLAGFPWFSSGHGCHGPPA